MFYPPHGLLLNLLLIPAFGIFFSCFGKKDVYFHGLILSTIAYLWSLLIWKLFNINNIAPMFFNFHFIPEFNLNYTIIVDHISIVFLVLVTFITPIALLSQNFFYNEELRDPEFVFYIFIIEFLLINSFLVLDVLFFFIFFEMLVIPVYFLIGIWGSRGRKIKADNYFFLYTLLSSNFLLFGLIFIYAEIGSTSYFDILLSNFSYKKQIFFWFLFFLTFASKIPMFPFHIWLPEAHVEAPTAVSIILASLLLKLGGYGFIRFVIPLFPIANYFFWPMLCLVVFFSVTYGSLFAISQVDLKKIIAYSSIVHMNFAILGLFTLNIYGHVGCIFLMLSHGITSTGLFLSVGVLYDRYHTRITDYYSGLVAIMPLFSIFFFIFFISNIGFPGTANFISEFLLFLSIGFKNFFILFLMFPSFLLSLLYCIFIFNKICFGTLSFFLNGVNFDITIREFYLLFSLSFFIFLFGLFPQVILNVIMVF